MLCVEDQREKKYKENEIKVKKKEERGRKPCSDDMTINKMTQRNNEQSNSREFIVV